MQASGGGAVGFVLGRRALGLVLLLCVVFIWVASSFLVSNLFGEQEFNQPFFITYLNTGTFSLYLVGPILLALFRRGSSQAERQQQQQQQRHHRSSDDLSAPEASPLVESSSSSGDESGRRLSEASPTPLTPAV
ncbi:hypothetical protein H4217_009239, partial [Coemansia sp. RSA 1939]